MKSIITLKRLVAQCLLFSILLCAFLPLMCLNVNAEPNSNNSSVSDNTAPTIDSYSISGVSSVGSFSFFAPNSTITISAHDDVAGNLVKIIKETYVSDTLVSTTEHDIDISTSSTQIDVGYTGFGSVYFKLFAEDEAGNRTTSPVILPSGGAAFYDGMAPRVEVSVGDNYYCDDNDNVYIGKYDISSGINIDISLSDNPVDEDTENEIEGNASGLSSFAVYLNDVQIDYEYVAPDEQHPSGSNGSAIITSFGNDIYNYGPIHINTKQLTSAANTDYNHYVLRVEASDKIGNNVSKNINIYVDKTAPEVVNTKIADIDISGGFTKYAYINKAVTDTIHVVVVDPHDDNVGGYESGVKKIKYSFIWASGGSTSGEKEITGNSTDINIPNDFKGNVEIIAVDNVGNETRSSFKTQGIIIESQGKHDSEKHIKVTLPETACRDSEGHNLYNTNTNVEVEVIDSYSGVARLEYEVTAPYDEGFKGAIDFASDEKEGFSVGTDKYGLKDSAKGKITVPTNSNNIRMKLHMYDRLGYEDTEEVVLSIDKNKPVIETKLLNVNADEDYAYYYNDKQSVEIRVSDSNFDSSAVSISCNKNIVNSSVKDFTLESVSANGISTYKATVTYSSDDEYNICINATDKAGNSVSKNKAEYFVIDTTSPNVEFYFDEAEGKGIYYREDRIMHVNIKEKNFSPTRTSLSSNNTKSYLPYMHDWEGDSDKSYYERTGNNTTSVSFNSSGIYDFDITSVDKAGNSISVNVPEFVIDKETPTIEYTGVTYGDTYQGTISPTIRVKDVNYDSKTLTVSMNGAVHGKLDIDDYISSYDDIEGGQNVVFKTIGADRALDDIYTISVTNEDKAGNITVSDMIFTLNSSGSVFEKSIGDTDLYNGYLRDKKDVIITEINPDTINTTDLVITLYKNGIPKILERGKDYELKYSKDKYGYSCYQYIVNNDEISLDGVYELTVQSVDRAGNVNESMSDYNNMEYRFAVDNTPPTVITYDIEDGKKISAQQYDLYFNTLDGMELSEVKVYDDNKELVVNQKDGLSYVTLNENANSRTITIVATDKAGNENKLIINNITVKRPWIKRFVESKGGKIAITVVLGMIVVGISLFIIKKRKIIFTKNRL